MHPNSYVEELCKNSLRRYSKMVDNGFPFNHHIYFGRFSVKKLVKGQGLKGMIELQVILEMLLSCFGYSRDIIAGSTVVFFIVSRA